MPDHIAEVTDLEPGTDVVVRHRVLYDKETGRPEEIGYSYIPAGIAAGTYLEKPTVVPKALFLCVEELAGKRYANVVDRWVWRMPTVPEAETLQITSGTGVVHLIHFAHAEEDTLLEVSESIWPASRIEIIDEYDVAQEAEDAEGLSDV